MITEGTTGTYFCFEGTHGSGKSLLAKAFEHSLRRREIPVGGIAFPSEGAIGRLIRSYLRGDSDVPNPKMLLYMYAADGHAADPWMRSVLRSGSHLVADRHPVIAGRVFQRAHHPLDHIIQVHGSTDLVVPDVLFVVDVPPAATIERLRTREKYKAKLWETDDEVQLALYRHRYLDIAGEAEILGLAQRCVILDGTLPADELLAQVRSYEPRAEAA